VEEGEAAIAVEVRACVRTRFDVLCPIPPLFFGWVWMQANRQEEREALPRKNSSSTLLFSLLSSVIFVLVPPFRRFRCLYRTGVLQFFEVYCLVYYKYPAPLMRWHRGVRLLAQFMRTWKLPLLTDRFLPA
jgi:hypothetical protein